MSRYTSLSGIRFIAMVLILQYTCFPSIAQLNESDTVRFRFRGNITGNYQQGNVEVLTLRSRADLVYSPFKHIVYKTQNNSLYQSFYGAQADNDLFSRNYLYYKPGNTIYPFAIGYASANYRRRIRSRVFAGAGATAQLLRKKNTVIKTSLSFVYERSLFRDSTYNFSMFNGKAGIRCWRATFYSGGWFNAPGKKMKLFYDVFYQPAIGLKQNYRTQADIGLDIPVWKGLAFSTMYTFTHENVVIQKIKKQDKILSFGLSWSFSKNNQL